MCWPVVAPALVVIGGFPGSGKTALARRLAARFSWPCLASDTIGGSIRDTLDEVPSGRAFRAGYAVLFTLAEEFLGLGCPVLIDTNMGWEFQWREVDAILSRRPDAIAAPILLRCPYQVCLDRIDQRHREDPAQPTAAELQTVGHIPRVRQFLDDIDRPDVHVIDADRPADAVFADAEKYVTGRLARR